MDAMVNGVVKRVTVARNFWLGEKTGSEWSLHLRYVCHRHCLRSLLQHLLSTLLKHHAASTGSYSSEDVVVSQLLLFDDREADLIASRTCKSRRDQPLVVDCIACLCGWRLG
jgi:hypothetical protein